MTDHPIIFSAPMVRALIEGRKTMTRRLAWREVTTPRRLSIGSSLADGCEYVQRRQASPWQKVQPGDRLWVRETWKPHSIYAGMKPREIPQSKVFFAADDGYAPSNTPWVPPIHMPRWASRLTLLVTAVKIERLQSITPADAIAEGIAPAANSQTIDCDTPNPVYGFRDLWSSLHGADAWDANPAVVAVSFEVHKVNIDRMREAA